MDKEEISRRLARALQKLERQDHYLFVHDLNERTITHRLAMYLQEEFPEMDVDCEYNRVDFEIKRLDFYPANTRTDDTDAKTVFPDIIVHKRGAKGPNLLVIEAKKTTNRSGDDLEKLKAFKSNPHLKYDYAIFLQLRTGPEPGVERPEFI